MFSYFTKDNPFLNKNVNTEKFISDNISNFVIVLNNGSSGTILNHQLNKVKPNTKIPASTQDKVNLNIEKGSFVFSVFLVLLRVNSNKIPQMPVDITDKLGI